MSSGILNGRPVKEGVNRRLHPAEPLTKKCFVDSGDGTEPAARVAVHRGVADSGFAAVAGGKQQGVADVREHPDARRADARLNVLKREIIAFPIKLSPQS